MVHRCCIVLFGQRVSISKSRKVDACLTKETNIQISSEMALKAIFRVKNDNFTRVNSKKCSNF